MLRNYTAEDVRRYRDEHSCGVFTAKDHFERQHFLELVDIAHLNKDFDLLCDIVRELVMKAKFV
jgi:hypothetical protein